MSVSRIPSLNWLRVFEAAARTQSFVRAAELLNMSAPAVSQQIKALEGYLGRDLFERGAHSVRLSSAGEAFLPAVQQALFSVETAAAGLFGTRVQTTVHVQATLLLAVSWLAGTLDEFHGEHPDIRIRLTTANTREDIMREMPDVSIVFGKMNLPGPRAEQLMLEHLFPVATPELADKIKTPEDLLDHPLLEVETHRSGWLQVFASLGLEPRAQPRFEYTDSTVLSLARAQAGTAVALARSPACDALMQRHGLVACLPAYEPTVGLDSFWLQTAANPSPEIQAVSKWLQDKAQVEHTVKTGR